MSAQPLDAIATWYQELSPDNLEAIDAYFHEEVYFKNPFHEFADRNSLVALYQRMFERLEAPRFIVDQRIGDATQGVLVWRFFFDFKGRPYCVCGVSHLRFTVDGRVLSCHDYWDAAEQIYERLPVVGRLLRLLKKRLR